MALKNGVIGTSRVTVIRWIECVHDYHALDLPHIFMFYSGTIWRLGILYLMWQAVAVGKSTATPCQAIGQIDGALSNGITSKGTTEEVPRVCYRFGVFKSMMPWT